MNQQRYFMPTVRAIFAPVAFALGLVSTSSLSLRRRRFFISRLWIS